MIWHQIKHYPVRDGLRPMLHFGWQRPVDGSEAPPLDRLNAFLDANPEPTLLLDVEIIPPPWAPFDGALIPESEWAALQDRWETDVLALVDAARTHSDRRIGIYNVPLVDPFMLAAFAAGNRTVTARIDRHTELTLGRATAPSVERWRGVADGVDFICPSLYLAADSPPPGQWVSKLATRWRWINKPVLPLLWTRYLGAPGAVAPEAIVALVRALVTVGITEAGWWRDGVGAQVTDADRQTMEAGMRA
jgi:hypothetical protein